MALSDASGERPATASRLLALPGLRAFASPGFRLACAVVLCLGSLAGFALNALGALANYAGDADIHTLWTTTTRFWSGLPTYVLPPATAAPDRFLTGPTAEPYPPTTFALLWPWSTMPDALARLTWVGLELAALAALIWLVYAGIGRPTPTEALSAVALVLLFLPVRETVFEGQFGILLTALVAAAALLWERGRDRAAGALLAVGIAIKLTPALTLLYLLQRRLLRAVAWTAAAVLAILAATLLAGWLPRWLDYLHLMGPIGRGTAFAGNQSLPGVILRLLRPDLSGQPIPPPPVWITALSALAEAGALVALLWALGGSVHWRRGSIPGDAWGSSVEHAKGSSAGSAAGSSVDHAKGSSAGSAAGSSVPARQLLRGLGGGWRGKGGPQGPVPWGVALPRQAPPNPRKQLTHWTELSLVLTVLPLIQPFAWFHHWSSAIPAVIISTRLARLGQLKSLPLCALLAAYALTLATYPTYRLVRNIPGPDLATHPLALALSCVFFVAVLLGSIGLAAALRDVRANTGLGAAQA